MIKNRATVNEDLDPNAVIRRLKGEILTLREEIAFLKVIRNALRLFFKMVVYYLVFNQIIYMLRAGRSGGRRGAVATVSSRP